MKTDINRRWIYLILGVFCLLFAGIIYGWSILKTPFTDQWDAPALAMNFTITMSFFCIGGFVGAKLSKQLGIRITLIISAIFSSAGFCITALSGGNNIILLYLSYGILAGLGIGIAYNVIISTVNAWFPDKKGLCSGCLMMGFGASSLIIGNLVSSIMTLWSWQSAYVLLGSALFIILLITAFVLKRPEAGMALPCVSPKKHRQEEAFSATDYATTDMLRRKSFWMAFFSIGFLAAVGSSVISFAKDLVLSVTDNVALATTMVGILSVCNGLGRIFTGALFDAKGRRYTMMVSNLLTIAAAGVTLLAVSIHSLWLCIAGLCLVGMSYGSCPTVSSAFVSAFYGTKYFPTNFSIMNFNLIGSSLMATACSSLLSSTGGYITPFIVLLILSIVALGLNFTLKKP